MDGTMININRPGDYHQSVAADDNHVIFLRKSVFQAAEEDSFVTLLIFLYTFRKADENGIAYFTKPDTKRSAG